MFTPNSRKVKMLNRELEKDYKSRNALYPRPLEIATTAHQIEAT